MKEKIMGQHFWEDTYEKIREDEGESSKKK